MPGSCHSVARVWSDLFGEGRALGRAKLLRLDDAYVPDEERATRVSGAIMHTSALVLRRYTSSMLRPLAILRVRRRLFVASCDPSR